MSEDTVYEPRTRDGVENKNAILKELREGPLTFGELLEDTGLPRGTVGRHLKKMLNSEEVFIVWDKVRGKKVYSANRKLIINRLLLPELLRYVGSDLLGRMFYKMTQGEKELKIVWGYQPEEGGFEAQPLYKTYDLDRIFNLFIDEKYFTKEGERKITPQEVLNEIISDPELMKYIRSITSKEEEKSWLDEEMGES